MSDERRTPAAPDLTRGEDERRDVVARALAAALVDEEACPDGPPESVVDLMRGVFDEVVAPLLRAPTAADTSSQDDPHPWYGDCDAFGPGDECSECAKRRFASRAAWEAWLRSDASSQEGREDGALTAEGLARLFHETYERLAPEHGYETREASAVPWDRVPEQNRNLMIAVAGTVLDRLAARPREDWALTEREVKLVESLRDFANHKLCARPQEVAAVVAIIDRRAARPVPAAPDDDNDEYGPVVITEADRTRIRRPPAAPLTREHAEALNRILDAAATGVAMEQEDAVRCAVLVREVRDHIDASEPSEEWQAKYRRLRNDFHAAIAEKLVGAGTVAEYAAAEAALDAHVGIRASVGAAPVPAAPLTREHAEAVLEAKRMLADHAHMSTEALHKMLVRCNEVARYIEASEPSEEWVREYREHLNAFSRAVGWAALATVEEHPVTPAQLAIAKHHAPTVAEKRRALDAHVGIRANEEANDG